MKWPQVGEFGWPPGVRNHFPRNSEKAIQGRYVTDQLNSKRRDGFFIDTEFEYSVRQKNGKWRIGRIDLVWVDRDSRQIVLVELKTRNDARIQPQNAGRPGSIEDQLGEYGQFLGDAKNQAEIRTHYEMVYQVKKRLGLLKGFTKHPSCKRSTCTVFPPVFASGRTIRILLRT